MPLTPRLMSAAGPVGHQLAKVIQNRLTDHGEILPNALKKANDRAWESVALALAEEGLFDRFEPLDAPAMLRAYFDRLFPRDGRPQ